MKNIVTIQNVRGYCDEQGTAWINAEDVARGLGFVEVKKDRVATRGDNYEAVRWARVNGYLREFGFSQDVAKDDFIPENMVYRLAMKAKNEVAETFQAKIADEILPAIRKTGSYSIAVKQLPPVSYALGDVEIAVEKIQSLFAVKRGIAIAQAMDTVGKVHNVELDGLKQLIPPAEHETGFLNPTQIGKRLGGIPPQFINKMLAEKGLEHKEGKYWRLTEAGKEYGEELPFTCNGHSGYQIRWSEKVVDILRAYLNGDAA